MHHNLRTEDYLLKEIERWDRSPHNKLLFGFSLVGVMLKGGATEVMQQNGGKTFPPAVVKF